MHLIIYNYDKNCDGDIPARIRDGVVQIRVKRTYMRTVVRVATNQRNRTINPCIFIKLLFYIKGTHLRVSPLATLRSAIHPFTIVVYKKGRRRYASSQQRRRSSDARKTHPHENRCPSCHQP